MKVWKAFARSRGLRITCFALAGALLIASGIGIWYSLAAPSEVEIPGASYQHTGKFDYLVYLKANSLYGEFIPPEEKDTEEVEEEIPMVFFRGIIDEARLAFSYKFDSNQSLANVNNEVVVTITAENPGVWQKEMTELEETHGGKEFRVEFPLSIDSLENVVDEIEEDIGVTSSDRRFIIEATVHTAAETAQGKVIEDDFSHAITAVLKTKTLELTGPLYSNNIATKEGVSYTEEGWFDYEVALKPNKLYGPVVLKSEGPPAGEPVPSSPSPPQTLGPGLIYFPKIIDNIQASFSYQFSCDIQITEQSEEVEIIAIIENPNKWSKSFVVVPKTQKQGKFTISFPVDIHYFSNVIDAIREETGAGGGAYNLKIEADVHTRAQTDLGKVDEVYTQTLEGTLEGNTITLGHELSKSQQGSIGGVTASSSSGQAGLSMPWLAGLLVALLALGYFGWSQTRLGLATISAGEAEAARARKKYRQMMVDVDALPGVKPTETAIHLNSLDDLARIADDLVKPILHQAEEGRHSYCVIDSGVRYLYIVET